MAPGRPSDRPSRLRRLVLDAFAGWGKHANSQMAAAIAYFSALTLAPTLLIVLMGAGLFFDQATVADAISSRLSAVLGPDTVTYLTEAMRRLFDVRSNSSLAIVGFFTLLFAATGLLLQIRLGLRRIWGTTPEGGAVGSQLRERGAALLALGVLVAAMILLFAAWWVISAFSARFAVGTLKSLSTAGLSFAIAIIAYRFFPAARVTWKAALVGAAFATLGWAAVSQGIGIYFSVVPTVSIYGAAGSLIVALVWVYMMSLVMLFGAELARAFDATA